MCCLFGILDYEHRINAKDLTRIITVLSRECEIRGTDATGIAYVSNGNLSIYKRPVPAHRMRFRLPHDCHVVMGHTRLTTQGCEKFNGNNHPFRGQVRNMAFALAHNGVLHNDKRLQAAEKLPPTDIKTDSYVAVQLIEKRKVLDFKSLKFMAERVEGSFSFTVLDQSGSLYFVKGDSPMCIYRFSSLGFYLYASTEDILNKAVRHLGLQGYEHEQVKISGGDILKIGPNGNESRERFEFNDFSAWGYRFGNRFRDPYDEEHWEELKWMAGSFGYLPEDIDRLQRLGYSPDAVEEILYYGETLWDECTVTNL